MAPFRVCDKEVHGSPAAKVFKIIGLVILGIIGFTALAIIFGLVIQWLWNQLMPAIFGLPELSYWQAVGIAVLAKILFGNGHGQHIHEKRDKVKSRIGNHAKVSVSNGHFRAESEINGPKDVEWSSFREFWNDQGRDAYRDWLHGRKEEE